MFVGHKRQAPHGKNVHRLDAGGETEGWLKFQLDSKTFVAIHFFRVGGGPNNSKQGRQFVTVNRAAEVPAAFPLR
jgi:hypothetical protein